VIALFGQNGIKKRMNKILEYRTACGLGPSGLDEEVNKLLKEGFIPYGQQYISEKKVFVQAMVKEAPPVKHRVGAL